MNKLLLTTAFALTLTLPAYAAGTHGGGHADAKTSPIGMAGDATKVDRTIAITMVETEGGEMLLQGEELTFKKGETIRFAFQNKGELEHEFVLDTVEGNAAHKIQMSKIDMEHDDPNSIRLDAGATGEVVWTFSNDGTFEAACLIPGHYESGMHREVVVGEQVAQADIVYTSGTIKKVDAKSGKVTINHGPLLNLDMPAMTMVFRADEALLAKMSAGQAIEFVAEPVKGKLTVVQVK
ncbi:putative cupredoxin-like copper-binding protein [Sulfitobacter undariae]|uniref:Putative cupredoxin-like copper-binding protein n=1 Tax=Sulfitobacter undariae TaxID=1563671 RepID=A0A7W6EBE2_9RHOB|nr:copper-binding protein [Sulfitobacter undariae]MBB3995520.1 putative cupredoxin-like copper-binding protein [Sulfitobacter undariae]